MIARRADRRRLLDGSPAAPLALLFGLNAVDELDRSAFGVLVPTIRDSFGMDNQGVLTVVSIVAIVALGGQTIIGYFADRSSRVRLALVGATVWAAFTALTGLAPSVWVLVVARSLSGVGRAVNDPTHNALLADYYPPTVRPAVYGIHRAANGVGLIVGPALGGLLAHLFGWRAPFLVFWIPTVAIVALAATRLREPVRGQHERAAMGASAEVAATEEEPPSFGEAWRICFQIRTLRRIWYAMPFLASALVGLSSLNAIFYEEAFSLDAFERGLVAAFIEPFQMIGVLVGIPVGVRLARRGPGLVLRFLSIVGAIVAVAMCAFAAAPSLPVAIAANAAVSSMLGVLTPGMYSTLSLVLPARARSIGFAIGSLYVLPGVAVLSIIGAIADSVGVRAGVLVLVPVFLTGAILLSSAAPFVAGDIERVRTSSVAQAEVRLARRRGEVKLLLVKDIHAGYGANKVLSGIDLEVGEGEIIALLGTNGAGKSTLLNVISGLLPPDQGAVVFDGVAITHMPAQEIVARGVVQMPGGRAVFPTLTVEDNLRLGGWLLGRDAEALATVTQRCFDHFPILFDRRHELAGNLSGGEQQMLALSLAFIARPRLLMIDELSLGLAPAIVEQLLGIIRELRAEGTTIILVEQSVNVALTVAETAYFLERGTIRFRGPTVELLERPDLLRSVFLEGDRSSTPTVVEAAARPPSARVAGGTQGTVVLDVAGLSVEFGGIAALRSVDLTLRSDEIVGIIGPNGAGKTTLFDAISGLVATSSGTVRVCGEDVSGSRPEMRARLGLGRSFQDARLFPAMTVEETIAVACERHVRNRDPVAAALGSAATAISERLVRSEVERLVELLHLERYSRTFIGALSTGTRRVVDLACVLAHRPAALLLDEPSSGMAQREAEALGPLIHDIRHHTGAGIAIIEHDIPLVTAVAEHLIAMELGQILVTGEPDEVISDPRVVETYLGTTAAVIHRSGAGRKQARTRAHQLRAGRSR